MGAPIAGCSCVFKHGTTEVGRANNVTLNRSAGEAKFEMRESLWAGALQGLKEWSIDIDNVWGVGAAPVARVGHKCLLTVDGATVACSKDVSLKASRKAIDTSSRAGAGIKSFLPGQREWSASAGLMSILDDAGLVKIETAYAAGTSVAATILDAAASGKGYEGNVIIKSINRAEPMEGGVALAVEMTGDGELAPSGRGADADALTALEATFFEDGASAMLTAVVEDPAGNKYTGQAFITSLGHEQPLEGAAKMPLKLQGTGVLSFTPFVA